MTERRRYTKPEKARAVAEAVLAGTEAASEKLGIPHSTLRYWMDDPEFVALRTKTHEAVAEEFWTTIQLGVRRVAELLPRTDDLQKVATATGILYDKHALLTGGATGRTESRELNDLPDSAYVEAIREAGRIHSRPGPHPAPEEEPAG